MQECKPITTPVETFLKLVTDSDEKPVNSTLYKQIVGSLRYSCHTRPDIAYGVGLISRFTKKKTYYFSSYCSKKDIKVCH